MKTNKSSDLRRALVGLLLGAATQVATAQNFIFNGGFESPVITANTANNTIPTSWTYGSTPGIGWILNGNVGTEFASVLWPAAHSGLQYVIAGDAPTHVVFQTIGVPESGSYQLTWFDNLAIGGTAPPYSVVVLDSESNVVTGGTFQTGVGGDWQEQNLNVLLNSGTYSVGFVPQGVFGDYSLCLDDISLTAVAVPEPTEWTACVALGLTGFAAFRRYSRR